AAASCCRTARSCPARPAWRRCSPPIPTASRWARPPPACARPPAGRRRCCGATACRCAWPGRAAGSRWRRPRKAMVAPPEVLLLGGARAELAPLGDFTRGASLEPVAASGPRQALSRLASHDPLLAVIDLDMSRAPAAERRSGVHDVLRRLHSHHLNCIPLVYSA